MHPFSVTIIGSGNVATHFAKAFQQAGATIRQVYSRNPANARKLAKLTGAKATGSMARIESGADLYLVAVKDDAIAGLVKQLDAGDGIVVHTAGSVSIQALEGFSRYGIFYPLQTFSKKAAVRFEGLPLCIEASDKKTFRMLESLAELLGAKVYRLDSEQRAAAHLAAVFACNFSNHLYAVAEKLLHKYKLPFSLIRPLIEETAHKALVQSPSDSQTGPAFRNDKAVMKKHLDALRKNPGWKEIYRLLSADIYRNRKSRNS